MCKGQRRLNPLPRSRAALVSLFPQIVLPVRNPPSQTSSSAVLYLFGLGHEQNDWETNYCTRTIVTLLAATDNNGGGQSASPSCTSFSQPWPFDWIEPMYRKPSHVEKNTQYPFPGCGRCNACCMASQHTVPYVLYCYKSNSRTTLVVKRLVDACMHDTKI